MSDEHDSDDPMPASSGLTLGESIADKKAAEQGQEQSAHDEPSTLDELAGEAPGHESPMPVDDDDDPIEEAMFSGLLGAEGSGADHNQAFAVAMMEARNAAVSVGIPEDVFDDLTAGFKPIYDRYVAEGFQPKDALKHALASVDD